MEDKPIEEPKTQPENPTIDLDLDALAKPTRYIKFGGKAIAITTPSVEQLFRLMSMAGKIKNFDPKNMTPEKATEAYELFETTFKTIIPESKGLNMDIEQMFALLEFIVDIAMPKDKSILEKAGVKLDIDQKKIVSDSSEKSPDSSTSTQDTQSPAS